MKTDSRKKRKLFGEKSSWSKQFFFSSQTEDSVEILYKIAVLDYHFKEILRLESEKCEKKGIVSKTFVW